MGVNQLIRLFCFIRSNLLTYYRTTPQLATCSPHAQSAWKHICICNVILRLERSFEQILQWTINNTRIFKSSRGEQSSVIALYFINKRFIHLAGKKKPAHFEAVVYRGHTEIVMQYSTPLIAWNMLSYRLVLSAFHKQRLTDHALNQWPCCEHMH